MSREEMFAPLPSAGERRSRATRPSTDWRPVVPIPGDAAPPPQKHPKRGRPAAIWPYRSPSGEILGYVWRFDRAGGGKDFVPLTWCRAAPGGRCEWQWKGWAVLRPLYGLDRLAALPADAPVVVAEGEKAADAAQVLLPDWPGVTSPNGSKAAGKADWTPLAGRRVVLWPDADEAGRRYAEDVIRALREVGAEVSVIDPPPGVGDGWDPADALAEGWDTARARALADAARPATVWLATSRTRSKTKVRNLDQASPRARDGREGPPQRDRLIELAREGELWHSPDRDPFASVPANGHIENWPVRSKHFRRWLAGRYFDDCGGAPSGQGLEDALRVIEELALRGHCHRTWLRVGELDGKVYLDLCDSAWRAVEITSTGWQIVACPPVKFLRRGGMLPLPDPEGGESVELLRRFINVASDRDFCLIIGFLVGALRPTGPYLMLLINGEQGTAKSTLAEMIVSLVDPRKAPLRSLPRDERDLAVAADNRWMLAFDNLSRVPNFLSDALCRLSTGGGFGTRELHSDREEVLFDAQRPIILNGIPDLASRPDLADRAVIVTLTPISKGARQPRSRLWAAFEETRPALFGALLDAVAAALRDIDALDIEIYERMADAAQWVTAAERGLGWEPGSFLEAYRANRAGAVIASLESDAVASAIRDLIDTRGEFSGTMTDLLLQLDQLTTEKLRQSRAWPQAPSTLGSRLRRAAPVLREIGIEFSDGRNTTKDRTRIVTLSRAG